MSSRAVRIALSVAVVLAATLPYLGTLHAPFVFDDVTFTDHAGTLRPSSFLPGGEGYRAFPTRPVAYASFALNHAMGGLKPLGYHLVNVGIHAANALLVFALLLLVQRSPRFSTGGAERSSVGLAGLVALVFAAHPVQTEAVSYVVQRLASLAALWFLAAAAGYLKARQSSGARSAGWFAASWLFALLAIKTKEIAFTLPGVIALIELTWFEASWRRRALYVLPYVAVALLLPLTLLPEGLRVADILSAADEQTRLQTTVPRGVYLLTELRVLVTYLRLLVFPVGQNLDHDFPLHESLASLEVLFSLALLLSLSAAVLALCLRARKNGDGVLMLPAFGLAWFFVTLSVESSIIPIADVIFEHRLYLPSVGAFVGLGALGAAFLRRQALVPGAAVGVVIVLLLAGATVARNRVWAREVGLWEDAVAKSPAKARPRYNLGTAYGELGRTDEAIVQLELAVRLRPDHSRAWDNLGLEYAKKGRFQEAAAAHGRAITAEPERASPRYNLGRLYLTAFPERVSEAARLFEETVRLDPKHADAWVNLTAAALKLGEAPRALAAARRAVELAPARADARFNLGVARVLEGDLSGARAEAERLRRLDASLGVSLDQFIERAGASK